MANNSNAPSFLIGFMLLIVGSLNILTNDQLSGPIFIALGLITIISSIFRSRKYFNKIIYSITIVAVLALMLIGEYILSPAQNTIFYVLLLIMAIGILLGYYFSLKSQNFFTKKEKFLMGTGLVLFGVSFIILIGLIDNNFTLSLITGIFVSISIFIGLLLRKWRFGKVF